MTRSVADSTYLVELYRPDLAPGLLRRCVDDVRDCLLTSTARGIPTRFVCSVIVPDDEAFLVLVRAQSEQRVQQAFGSAGITVDRITIAEVATPTDP